MDQFKTDVYDALVKAYGERAITWSNKCLKVREGVTTLPADVVPCRYYIRYDGPGRSFEGIEIRPDKGATIINWPDQDDANGTAKNKATSLRYKRVVRGIKALENEMADKGVIEEVPSFMIECAVYNVPNERFSTESNLRNSLTALLVIGQALESGAYNDWLEVNRLKWLFRDSQPWRPSDAKKLVDAAFAYVRDN